MPAERHRCEGGAARAAAAHQGLSSARRLCRRRRGHRPAVRHDRRRDRAAGRGDQRAAMSSYYGADAGRYAVNARASRKTRRSPPPDPDVERAGAAVPAAGLLEADDELAKIRPRQPAGHGLAQHAAPLLALAALAGDDQNNARAARLRAAEECDERGDRRAPAACRAGRSCRRRSTRPRPESAQRLFLERRERGRRRLCGVGATFEGVAAAGLAFFSRFAGACGGASAAAFGAALASSQRFGGGSGRTVCRSRSQSPRSSSLSLRVIRRRALRRGTSAIIVARVADAAGARAGGAPPEPKKMSPRAGPTIAEPVSCAIIKPAETARLCSGSASSGASTQIGV